MKRLNVFWGTLIALVSTSTFAVVLPDPPDLPAKGYVLMDFQSGGVIVEQDGRAGLAPASLTKLMTAYVIGKEIDSGRLDWQDKVLVSENAWSLKFEGSSKMFIQPKDQIAIIDLMRGVIVQSGNDASVALAEHVAGSEAAFVTLMNAYAEKIGMRDTQFLNAHGLDSEGAQTTPFDIARLMRTIIKEAPDVYALYKDRSFKWNGINQYNRNKLLWDKSIDVDGGKTGYTELAGYSLVSSATEGSMRLISVVMGTNSKRARIEYSKNLLSYGFRFYDSKQVMKKGETELTAPVWKGENDRIDLKVSQDAFLTLPRSKVNSLQKRVVVDEPLIAPISQGDEIGRVIWQQDGKEVARYPLVSGQNVESGSLLTRITDTIQLWLHSMFSDLLSLFKGAKS